MSISAPAVLALDDRPISKSLDLILEPILSLLKTSHTVPNQSKDWRNRGYKLTNTNSKLLLPKTKLPTRGQWPLGEPKNAVKQAKKNAIEGEVHLIS